MHNTLDAIIKLQTDKIDYIEKYDNKEMEDSLTNKKMQECPFSCCF